MLFANAISEDKYLKVFNNGNMERDFTYVDDIVKGCFKAFDKQPSTNFFQVLNIGNGKPVKQMEFISTMENALG